MKKYLKKLVSLILGASVGLAGLGCAIPAAANTMKFTVNNSDTLLSGAEAGNMLCFYDEAAVSFEMNKTEFNRYTFSYTLDKPVKAVVTLDKNGAGHDEECFFEAGNNMTFSSLTDGFAGGETALAVSAVTFLVIGGGKATLILDSLTTEKTDIPEYPVAYIANEKYKIGIDLQRGGAITYLEDLTDNDDTVGNLINNHDTGRLVQQSWYGTYSKPYETGVFMDNPWAYNPVQGGDRFNKTGKLVDFRISENEIYIKSRPLDWGHENKFTCVYYENTYTVDYSTVRVDNSVVDFSGYFNPVTDQELPALYTVSYLGNLYYYNGKNPWTDDALSFRADLGFWSTDKSGNIMFDPENDETWTAWVNNSGWGLGLYVPNTKEISSGRFRYDGSKSPSDASTSYVAPIKRLALETGKKISYSYLLTTGGIVDIRSTFADNRNFTDNAGLTQSNIDSIDYENLDFSNRDVSRLLYGQFESSVSYCGEYAELSGQNLTANDPYMFLDYSAANRTAEDYPYVVLTYSLPDTNSRKDYNFEVFFISGSMAGAEGGKSQIFSTTADNEIRSQIIDLSSCDYWNGKISELRFDFFTDCAEGDSVRLYSAALAKSADEAKAVTDNNRIKASREIIKGDSNGDGKLDSSDALLILQHSVGIAGIDPARLTNSDMNSDNRVNTADALLVLKKTVE